MLFAVVLCLTGFVGVASGGSHQSQHALHLGYHVIAAASN